MPMSALVAVFFICEILPRLLPQTDFAIDYGFFGVLFPLLIYFPRSKRAKLVWITVGLLALSFDLGGVQLACLLSLPLLWIYNGQRGKLRLKYLFYVYYPLHLAVLWCINLLVFQ